MQMDSFWVSLSDWRLINKDTWEILLTTHMIRNESHLGGRNELLLLFSKLVQIKCNTCGNCTFSFSSAVHWNDCRFTIWIGDLWFGFLFSMSLLSTNKNHTDFENGNEKKRVFLADGDLWSHLDLCSFALFTLVHLFVLNAFFSSRLEAYLL